MLKFRIKLSLLDFLKSIIFLHLIFFSNIETQVFILLSFWKNFFEVMIDYLIFKINFYSLHNFNKILLNFCSRDPSKMNSITAVCLWHFIKAETRAKKLLRNQLSFYLGFFSANNCCFFILKLQGIHLWLTCVFWQLNYNDLVCCLFVIIRLNILYFNLLCGLWNKLD